MGVNCGVSKSNESNSAAWPTKRDAAKILEEISDTRVKVALRTHHGNFAATARALGLTRDAVMLRVQRDHDLQAFMRGILEENADVLEYKIVEVCERGDRVMLRYYAATKLGHRGYGLKPDLKEAPPDPEAERRHQETVRRVSKLIEDNQRAGLPPIFAKG